MVSLANKPVRLVNRPSQTIYIIEAYDLGISLLKHWVQDFI